MASRFSDPSWWPTPPPERPAPVSKIVVGTVIPVLAVIGAVVAVVLLGHDGRDTSAAVSVTVEGAVTTQTRTVSQSEAERRSAFTDCMRSAGGNGPSARGRLGRSGPSEQFRRAFDVCRSLLQPGTAPARPPSSKPAAAPVA